MCVYLHLGFAKKQCTSQDSGFIYINIYIFYPTTFLFFLANLDEFKKKKFSLFVKFSGQSSWQIFLRMKTTINTKNLNAHSLRFFFFFKGAEEGLQGDLLTEGEKSEIKPRTKA